MSPFLLREPEVRNPTNFFPTPVSDLQEGIKYLGFHLKPNDYRKSDWKWLIGKLEKDYYCGAINGYQGLAA